MTRRTTTHLQVPGGAVWIAFFSCCVLLSADSRQAIAQQSATKSSADQQALKDTDQAPASPQSRSETLQVIVVDDGDTPLAGIAVRPLREGGDDLVVTTDSAGLCTIPHAYEPGDVVAFLIASDASGARQAYLEWNFREHGEPVKPLRMLLKPAREVAIRVTDEAGDAVSNALVGLISWRQRSTMDHARTSVTGTARLRLPADAKVGSVFALKSGLGFDNWVSQADRSSPELRELPHELALTLDGAQTVRIRVLDSAGKPVNGVGIFPKSLQKKPGPSAPTTYFRNCRLVDALTDKQGVATIDWIPGELQGTLQFDLHSRDYVILDLDKMGLAFFNGDRDLTTKVLRRTRISGRVTGMNGQPDAGIVVLAQGMGRTQVYRTPVRTTADGTYAIDVVPNRIYAVGIDDDDWAAESLLGVMVEENVPVGGLDLVLERGTVIRGTVTKGAERVPFSNAFIRVDETARDPEAPARIRPNSGSIMRFAWTSKQGEYRIRVGRGDYSLTTPRLAELQERREELKVSDETEIVRDLHVEPQPEAAPVRRRRAAEVKMPEKGVLTGQILGPDDKPLKGASIQGLYAATIPDGAPPMKSRSDSAGEFATERLLAPLWLAAWSADGMLGAAMKVDADRNSVTLTLAPTATTIGRLIEGDAPVAGLNMSLSLWLDATGPQGRAQKRSFAIGNASATAADGRFVFAGLIAGQEYRVQLEFERARPNASTLSLKADRPGNFDVGYVEIPPRMRIARSDDGVQWIHIDVAHRIASQFDNGTDLAARISTALGDSKREHRRLMLLLGDPRSEATRTVFEVLDGLEGVDDWAAYRQKREAVTIRKNGLDVLDEFTRAMADFFRVYIDVTDSSAIAELAKAHRIDVAKLDLPAVVILNDEGRVAAQRWFAPSGDPPRVNVEALRTFVQSQAPPVRNAAELLDQALRQARDEGKRVLFQQSRTGSHASRLLARFIDQHRDLLDRDYVYLNLDPQRTVGGDAVIGKFREYRRVLPRIHGPELLISWQNANEIRAGDGSAWMAILNADGTKAVDSDSPAGNIGFPCEPAGIRYFIDKMLKPTAERLTPADLDVLRNALEGK